MMSIHEYVNQLRDNNIVISVLGDDLKIKAPKEALTQEVVEALRIRKSEILDYFKNSSYYHIPLAEDQEFYPLSHSQKRLWVLDQVVDAKGVYNISLILPFLSLDVACFNKAFSHLLSRHEILRTTFHTVDGEPRQWVRSLEEFNEPLEIQKLKASDSLNAVLDTEAFYPLDLSKASFRGKLIEMPDGSSIFLFVLHHIISDAWSNNVLKRDFNILYNHYSTGSPLELAPLRIQYKDYARWQYERLRLGYFEPSLQYWKSKLADELPVLNLPFDFKHTDFKTYHGASVSFELPSDLVNKISIIGNAHQASLYMVMVGMVKSFLYRYTNLQEDIIVGSVVTGREHLDLENQVGFYVNTIVLRSSLKETDSFNTFLDKVRHTVLEAYEHQHLPFDLLIDQLNLHKDMSRNPVFDVMISFDDSTNTDASSSASKDPSEDVLRTDDEGVNKFDLSFTFSKLGNGSLNVDINYNKGLFKKEKVMKMASHLKNLVMAIVENPQLEIYKLEMLSQEEISQLINVFNNTRKDVNLDLSIKEHFEKQVKVNPSQVCIISNSGPLTFEEVNRKANQMAHYLIDKYHVAAGSYVGVMMGSGLERIIALIGLIKIGAAYVPIDPDYPRERKLYIINDTKITIVLTSDEKPLASESSINSTVSFVPVNLKELGDVRSENIEILTSSDDVLTILYTSGSTGNPKGVLIQQKGIINRMQWLWGHYKFGADDVIYQKTPIVFDVSIGELFMPLCFGAKLLIAGSNSSDEIVTNIVKHNVTYIHFSPTMLNQFLNTLVGESQIVSLRYVFASGEALLKETVNRFYSRFAVPLINLYGPTEASIEASVYETRPGDDVIPIGTPIANVKLYILDNKNGLLPVGVPGEIGIGGIGVAKGYLNDPQKTKEKFISNEFHPGDGQRIYKTGDVGFWNSSGQIEFLGRRDSQTNINGLRIELGEIESALLTHQVIREAVVIVETDAFDNYHLIAYYTKKNSHLITPLREANNHTTRFDELAVQVDYEISAGVDELFSKMASENAEQIAVVFGIKKLTYKSLDEKSGQLAFSLITDYQIKPGDCVGVLMERSEKTIITLLAILKAGATYVPLDTIYPEPRIQYILQDASVRAILVERKEAARNFASQITKVVYEDVEDRFSKNPPSVKTAKKRSLHDLCYICYTSGSTGVPKGVMIEHHSVVDYIKTFTNYFSLTKNDVVLQQASIAFDTSVEEIFPILCVGGKLIIHSGGGQDIDTLIRIANENQITLISTTPLVIGELNSRHREIKSWPRVLISGGDELKQGYVDNIIDKVNLYNTYGPTETTVCATFALIKDIRKCNVIGSPITNHKIYILNEELELVGAGEVGEICISGPGLARGYVNMKEETKTKFVSNPFGEGLLYRTGDLGRRNVDGVLEFSGRKDRQVKVRGYRVELSEIDSALARYKQGLVSLTVAKRDASGNNRLITFFKSVEHTDPKEIRSFLISELPHFMVPDYVERIDEFPKTTNGKLDVNALPMPTGLTIDHSLNLELKDFLREKLPAYMVPSQFRNLEKIPLTVTGKIDRKVLEALASTYNGGNEFIAPRTQTEIKLAKIWEDILKRPHIGLMHSFFEVGGNSLKAVQILSAIYREFGKEVSLKDIFNNPTINDLARLIEYHGINNSLLIQLSAIKETNQNIFFIPPVLGSSTIFTSLANEMNEFFNSYGLQYKGFDTDVEFSKSIQEMARDFVLEIKEIEKGPSVSLVGYSMGVPIAFEMAKLLEEEGFTVQLIFIDRGAIPNGEEEIKQSNSKEVLDKVLEFEHKYWLKYLDGKNAERIKAMVYNNIQLLSRYAIHGKVKSNITAIEAKNNMDGWREYTSGDFSVKVIDAEHYEVLNAVHIPVLAKWISNSFSVKHQQKVSMVVR